MNEQEQRIAIAEICGWKWDDKTVWSPDGSRTARTNLANYRAPLEEFFPDYLHDLNAMHEAEEHAPSNYWNTLADLVGYGGMSITSQNLKRIAQATAAQRAEAFLRTVGMWEDS